jgi:integrase
MATIRKRLNKYQAQIRKDGNFISQTFINKTDAIKWTKEQEVLIEQGCYISKKESVTLAFLLTRWEQEVLVHLKSFKVEKYKVALVSRALGHLTLNNITSSVLVDYRDNRLQEVSNQTVKHELGLIRRALKKGIEWGYTSSVPYLASPSLKGQARNRRLSEVEMSLLLSSCDDYLKHIVIFLSESSMRRGELASIKIADINLESRLLQLSDTKNGRDRIIPLSSLALDSINYLIMHAQTPMLLGYEKEWLTRKFISHCKSIGIENFRLHDLRHEGISKLFEKGLNVMEVSSISGHKDLSMLKRYTHINPSTLLAKI